MTQSKDKGAGVSVLAAMTASVIEQAPKGEKSSLTVLPGEKNAPSILTTASPGLPPTPASFPNDAPTEVVQQSIVELERQIGILQGVVTALRLLAGDPEVVAAAIETTQAQTQKALEKEADRRHLDRVAAGKTPAKNKAEAAAAVRAQERIAAESPMKALAEQVIEEDSKAAMMLTALVEAGMGEPDEAFTDRLARLAEEAKAATFTRVADSTVEGGEDPEQPSGAAVALAEDQGVDIVGWLCPVHDKGVDKISTRRQRKYRKCPVEGCPEFEKL